jgi:hypothetical protein
MSYSPEENTYTCEENAKPNYCGDHHCVIKELLELHDFSVT